MKPYFPAFLLIGFFTMNLPAQNLAELFFFDHVYNPLFSVNFSYSSGTLTGRTLFDKDNYVISHTSIDRTGGTISKESYQNTNGGIDQYSTYSWSGSNKTGSLFNQFDELLYQYNYTASAPENSVDIKNSAGAVSYKLEYNRTNENLISTIKVSDAAGIPAHIIYARYEGQTGIRKHSPRIDSRILSIKKITPSQVQIEFLLQTRQSVEVKISPLTGAVLQHLSSNYPAGRHSLILNMTRYSMGSGTYIASVYINGNLTPLKIRLIK